MGSSERYVVNKKEFSRITGESERTLTRLIKEGMPVYTAGKKGVALQIDTARALAWMYEYKARVGGWVKSDSDLERIDAQNAKNHVYIEQHRKLKLENDETEKELVRAEEVRQLFSSVIVDLAAQLDGAAGKMAQGDAILRQRLLNEHRKIRETFAGQLSAYFDDEQSGEPDEAATG